MLNYPRNYSVWTQINKTKPKTTKISQASSFQLSWVQSFFGKITFSVSRSIWEKRKQELNRYKANWECVIHNKDYTKVQQWSVESAMHTQYIYKRYVQPMLTNTKRGTPQMTSMQRQYVQKDATSHCKQKTVKSQPNCIKLWIHSSEDTVTDSTRKRAHKNQHRKSN